jgi:hypothetical protein
MRRSPTAPEPLDAVAAQSALSPTSERMDGSAVAPGTYSLGRPFFAQARE